MTLLVYGALILLGICATAFLFGIACAVVLVAGSMRRPTHHPLPPTFGYDGARHGCEPRES